MDEPENGEPFLVRLLLMVLPTAVLGLWPSVNVHAAFGDWPDVFNPLQLRTLNLEMAPADWATVQNDTSLSIEVPALFWADGETSIVISVRRKSGDPLTADPRFQKVSLKLDINEYVVGQGWHGLKKLSLENGDDQDVVSEGFAWEIERLASGTQGYGYPVGYRAWVRLIINGVDTGVYVSVEQLDKRFLENRRLYVEGETWLYKVGDIGANDLKVGGPGDSLTLAALCYVPFNTRSPCPQPADLATHVPQYVDMKGILTLMASDAFQTNGDAMLTKGKNFFFADFLGGRKRMYYPWDRDSSLSGGAKNDSIYNANSPYATLLTIPEFRSQYNTIFNDLLCGPWSTQSLVAFLDSVEPVLTAALEADPNSKIPDAAAHFDGLRNWVTARVASVRSQIENYQSCPQIEVVLNEFMARNVGFIEDPDEAGEYPDWIEIYNPTATEMPLGGIYLTDDPSKPRKYQVPMGVSIPPDGYAVFWADENSPQGPLHTNFRLAEAGEEIYVFDRDGVTLLDSIAFTSQVADVSYGRYPNGTGVWGYMAGPTPGNPNTPHNMPPIISDTARTPEAPTSTDAVWVTARVTDDSAVVSVTLRYRNGGSWIDVAMNDDGAHRDGAAGDSVYGARIPPFPDGTLVQYYIVALDNLAGRRTDPLNSVSYPYSYFVGYVPPRIYINEIMADNKTIPDPDEPTAYEDWIELYNAEPTTVALGGMYLTDDLSNPRKYQIPAGVTISPGGYLLFWADEDSPQGPTHTNFKLAAPGEEVALFDSDEKGNMCIDSMVFEMQMTDVSYGRCPDGSSHLRTFDTPTPGSTNGSCTPSEVTKWKFY